MKKLQQRGIAHRHVPFSTEVKMKYARERWKSADWREFIFFAPQQIRR
ncbi:hypothetical protein EHW99_1443 [Erwinia amylovora]|uniref:Uncharacterized protein n=3 Tax=Erwinia amylovora TaxID=552 RepID=A0A831A2A6_ERWAM|nr:hypothetical protein EaACW_2154 [Erwinia amylovora ACW56400]QJQ54148.1 hypothetical protein EHX00_1443 [Erwinia amylovora]CBA21144.1 hypothetical protein predicted by Glimmer/Critica [Erwinia amylovora CFBP1430]CBX81017.1 hypothetical protein predicted by Glimmer/Critica [Erwinia amylovora ATCC BAA-2158]CCO79000.1 hypothetical protein BN432_2207 [Erwinia amylovora Ea356]CCO82801.1 hypothetical protein BN433_2235 [Erwinia amylovora Ea266]CCO86576.1 hypothetical protein BN434_2193 [Erwinia a